MNPCPTCGRRSKQGQKQERKQLVDDLGRLLQWDRDQIRRLYQANGAINQDQLRQLLYIVNQKRGLKWTELKTTNRR